MENRLRQPKDSLIHELARAMALPQTSTVKSVIRLLFGNASRSFLNMALGLDAEIEQNGPSAGERWLLPHFVAGYEARGEENIPADGPVLATWLICQYWTEISPDDRSFPSKFCSIYFTIGS